MEKNKSKLRAKLIRKIRNDLGWSIENLSTGIGISLSILSDIERGKRNLSDKNFEQIIKYLNIEYKYLSNEEIIKWQNLIDDLIDSFYYIDDEKIEFLIKKIADFEINGRFSDIYYYQSVMRLAQLAKISGITQYGDSDYEVKKIYSNIQSVRELLPVNVVAAADYFYAFYLLNIRRLIDSEKILNDNFLPGSDRTGQKHVILSNFLTIRICFRKKDFIRPLNIISEVKPKLEIDRNFSRILSLNHFQAYFYMALYRFEEALELYQELVPFLYSMHRETLLKRTKENIIWCHLMLENYEEAAIAMSDLEFEVGLNPASNVLYRILCLIQLNAVDEAMNLVNYYKKIETKDELVSPILEVFADLINGRYKMFKRHCKALINKFNKSECYGEMILFQRILVNELEKNGEFQEANELIREADKFILKRNYILKKL